ncbi:MAG: response regulator, partial [Magnetospirillum sp.]|nr:response regulator [Magnetospirillum sp.]
EAIYQQTSPCLFCKMPEMQLAANGGDASIEFEHFNDLDDRWYQLRETMLTWFDGRRAKYSIAVDISALKEIQNALAEAHAELALKNRDLETAVTLARKAERAKSEFLAVMSHEIRTPMNSILGMVHLLMDRPMAADDLEKLTIVRDSGDALLSIINDILDFSRLEADGVQFENSAFNLGNTVEGVVSLLRGRASEKGLTLVLDAPPPLPTWVMGDGARLRQVLINLIGNAVKFTAQGGIVLRVVQQQADRVEFSIIDTGIGMETEQIERLFTPFNQADASISRRFGGSGLGLAICKKLVEAQEGKIGVDSTRGLGSRFWFHLDFPAAKAPAGENPTTLPPVTGLSILLAEDNPFNQKVAVGLLNRDGHRVAVADSGAAALDLVGKDRFDLILMDMQMPEMDGPEATRRIRALPGLQASIPIVALTANAMADDIARCRAAGMDGHVAKPIDPISLRNTIAEILARRRPSAGAGQGTCEYYSLTRMAEHLGSAAADILARTFLESGEDICARLEISKDDPSALSRAVHELKGLAAYSGTPWLESLALQLDEAILNDSGDDIVHLLGSLRQNWETTKSEVRTQFRIDP